LFTYSCLVLSLFPRLYVSPDFRQRQTKMPHGIVRLRTPDSKTTHEE
jgi:hypothetical protein